MVVDSELKKKLIQLKAMHGPGMLTSLFLLNSKALKKNLAGSEVIRAILSLS